MKPSSHAFEIGYGPTWELLDHSEVYLDHLPGTDDFRLTVLPRFKDRLPATALAEAEQSMALLPRIEQWVQQDAVREEIRIGVDFTLTWERPATRVGIFSILAAQQIASITLLLCRDDERDEEEASFRSIHELTAFMTALSRFLGDEDVYDMRKFRLIELTRRPLMASLFWPPYSPANDTTARTIQLQFAYAFFRGNGEIA